MNRNAKPKVSRREFGRVAARHLGLGILLAVSGVLVRRGVSGVAASSCVNRGLCGECARFIQCTLPVAVSIRRRTARPHA